MFHSVSISGEPHPGDVPGHAVVTPHTVAAMVAADKNVSLPILMHASRCRAKAARARQLAMYLSHVMLGLSLRQVGEAFGRDRTTVSYACNLVEDLRDDPAFDADVEALEARIEAALAGAHA